MKETVAGVIFLLLWVIILGMWGNFHRVVPDLTADEPFREGNLGHPLWQE